MWVGRGRKGRDRKEREEKERRKGQGAQETRIEKK